MPEWQKPLVVDESSEFGGFSLDLVVLDTQPSPFEGGFPCICVVDWCVSKLCLLTPVTHSKRKACLPMFRIHP